MSLQSQEWAGRPEVADDDHSGMQPYSNLLDSLETD